MTSITPLQILMLKVILYQTNMDGWTENEKRLFALLVLKGIIEEFPEKKINEK